MRSLCPVRRKGGESMPKNAASENVLRAELGTSPRALGISFSVFRNPSYPCSAAQPVKAAESRPPPPVPFESIP